ncbi:MAG: Putative HAD-hydrolase YfnB [Candidatus Celerinatantimonas neptuna]|nr:MAG: Putative HAD-hydrolase YfnB [Candidatus Celerinatantimonas neptuna]
MNYQHIFFDLDHTLWDFERNARKALRQLYQQFLSLSQFSEQCFIDVYEQVNHQLWALFDRGGIDKQNLRRLRFPQTFEILHANESDYSISCDEMDQWYIEHCSKMDGLFSGCHQCLSALKQHFQLHLITNGFAETQHQKLLSSNLTGYFQQIFISDELGIHKPNPAIFEHAMSEVGAVAAECLMVGDNLVADIDGARKVGIDQVWFNPKSLNSNDPMTYQIHQLDELPKLLGIG